MVEISTDFDLCVCTSVLTYFDVARMNIHSFGLLEYIHPFRSQITQRVFRNTKESKWKNCLVFVKFPDDSILFCMYIKDYIVLLDRNEFRRKFEYIFL